MNWKKLPPDDWHSETDSVDEMERLSEIERRLKAARPKPVQFDAVAWERILSSSETAETAEQVTIATPGRTIPLRRRWNDRVVGTIAAAWLSGVLVGSGVMFLMMNRGGNITQADNRETPVAVAQQDIEDPSGSPDIRRQPKHDSSDFTSDTPAANAPSSDPSPRTGDGYDALPVMKLDSMYSVRSVSWLDASVFERDKPLRALDRELFERRTPDDLSSEPRHPETLFQKERLQQSETQRELARSFVPPPGATPRRILEELRMDGEIL